MAEDSKTCRVCKGPLTTRRSPVAGLCWLCARHHHQKQSKAALPSGACLPAQTSDPAEGPHFTWPACQQVYAGAALLDGLCWECSNRRRQAARAQRELLASSGIGDRHKKFRAWSELQGPADYQRAVSVVRRFVESGDSVVALIGKRGTGKTQVGAVAVRQTIAHGKPARIVTLMDLLADAKRRYSEADASGSDAAWKREWSAPHLLVIDEITEGGTSEWARTMFTDLVNKRYEANHPTFLVGNVTAVQFPEVVGDSIADRCNEGGGLVLFDSWSSFRTARPALKLLAEATA